MAERPNDKEFLSSDQAKSYALKGYNANKWAYPKEFSQAMEKAVAAEPLLVERMDRPDDFYYIVPFNKKEKTTVLVIIDARTGEMKEATYLKEPAIYPSVSWKEAQHKLIVHLREPKAEEEISRQNPAMAWKPSEESQSPYEPFWVIKVGGKSWYIGQNGKVYEKVSEIRLKGGGKP